MPLQSIVVVILRISAIQFAATALMGLISLVTVNMKTIWPIGTLYLCFPLLAILTWAFAEPIARLVTRAHETTVPLGGLTRQDLYAFAFVYLGLSFLVSNIGSVSMNLIAMMSNAMTHLAAHDTLFTQSAEQLAKQSVQVILGLICLINANRFAKKLTARDQ